MYVLEILQHSFPIRTTFWTKSCKCPFPHHNFIWTLYLNCGNSRDIKPFLTISAMSFTQMTNFPLKYWQLSSRRKIHFSEIFQSSQCAVERESSEVREPCLGNIAFCCLSQEQHIKRNQKQYKTNELPSFLPRINKGELTD